MELPSTAVEKILHRCRNEPIDQFTIANYIFENNVNDTFF